MMDRMGKSAVRCLFSVPACALVLFGCSLMNEDTEFHLGTVCTIQVYADALKGNRVINECFLELERIENLMSPTIPGSDVSAINSMAGIGYVPVSPDTLTVINTACMVSESSGGALDITLGGLIELWGIDSGNDVPPPAEEIRRLLPLVDYSNILIDEKNRQVMLKHKGMKINLGSIAKGYAADRVVSILKKRGISSALVSLGGNVCTLGTHPEKRSWSVGIMDPRDVDSFIGSVDMSTGTAVTSGDYQRYFMFEGKRYHHILDPNSGYPSESGIISVTVLCGNSMLADACSTALFVLGREKGMEFIGELNGIECVFITDEGKIYLSDGVRELFRIKPNTGYSIEDHQFSKTGSAGLISVLGMRIGIPVQRCYA